MLFKKFNKRLMCFALGSAISGGALQVPDATAADIAVTGSPEATVLPQPVFDQRFEQDQPSRNWSLIVGAGGIYEPSYEGSDEFELDPVPLVLFTYGEWLEIDPTGVTLTPIKYDRFSLSGQIGYESGRDEDDHERLRGLGDIDFAATVGAKAMYELGPVDVYAAIDQTIEGSESLIGTVGIGYTAPVSERLILGANAEAVVADDNHMEAYFGVNAAQSAASGLPEYEAGAGLKRVNFSASATYALTEDWLVRGEAELGVLTGDATDSPIVADELQPSVSLFVGYRF